MFFMCVTYEKLCEVCGMYGKPGEGVLGVLYTYGMLYECVCVQFLYRMLFEGVCVMYTKLCEVCCA
jgi:hypothetical protein